LPAHVTLAGVYVPSINDLDYVGNWQDAMSNVMREQIKDLNQANLASPTFSAALNSTLANLAKNLTAINDFKKNGECCGRCLDSWHCECSTSLPLPPAPSSTLHLMAGKHA
jgi:hypothetical protein